MAQDAKSWDEMIRMMRDLLIRGTGEDVAAWNAKIAAHGKPKDEDLANRPAGPPVTPVAWGRRVHAV